MGDNEAFTFWFDFDKTLSTKYQQHPFLMKYYDLWREKYAIEFPDAVCPVTYMSKIGNTRYEACDERVQWMWQLCDDAELWGKNVLEDFREAGRTVPIAKGLPEFFPAFKEHLKSLGIEPHFYVVSAGAEEMIEHNPVAEHMTGILSGKFRYHPDGSLDRPAVAVGGFLKTEVITRTVKGGKLNRIIALEDMKYDWRRASYIGDGFTDVPMFGMGQSKGGLTCAVGEEDKFFDFLNYDENNEVLNRLDGAVIQDYSINGPVWKMLTRFALIQRDRKSILDPEAINNYRKRRIKEREGKMVEEHQGLKELVEEEMKQCSWANAVGNDYLHLVDQKTEKIVTTRADKAYTLL